MLKTFRLTVYTAALGFLASVHAQNPLQLEENWKTEVSKLATIADGLPDLIENPQDVQVQLRLFDFIYQGIAMGYFGGVYANPKYPDFYPWLHEVFKQGWPNPDDVYYAVPLDDNGVYKISGLRGTVKVLDFQINAGKAIKDGTGSWGPALVNYSADDLHIGDNGWFEVVLSQTRPPGYKGDWWELGKGASWIMVRQRSYDWVNEVDGRFGIERLDLPAGQPNYTADELAERLNRIHTWAKTQTVLELQHAKASFENARTNEFTLINFENSGGFTGRVQSYPQTIFKLKKDEALIVETEVPGECRYWNFQLVDTLWETMGTNYNFNSINGYQAKLDADGKFRFVVSSVDPGVPNWLDNLGNETGFVYGRWNLCSSAPVPEAKKVKVSEVRKYLPRGTPVVSPEERDRLLRERRLAAQMRKRW